MVEREVQGERMHGVLGAILEGVQTELGEFVELELQFLQVVQMDERLGLDVFDPRI